MTIYEIFTRLVSAIGPLEYDDTAANLVKAIIKRPMVRDQHGNYWLEIGEDNKTCFAAHLDTVASTFTKPLLYQGVKDGELFVFTAGTSVLGADDRTGCTVLCHMILNNVPGLYYFFTGEEVGQQGSSQVAMDKTMVTRGIKHIIEFDRYGTDSIITHQSGTRTASDEFANALAGQFDAVGLPGYVKDPGGSFTDSEAFKRQVPECTNISVGYYSQHSDSEHQNVSHLERLCDAVVKVDWSILPAERDPSKEESRFSYYGSGYHSGWEMGRSIGRQHSLGYNWHGDLHEDDFVYDAEYDVWLTAKEKALLDGTDWEDNDLAEELSIRELAVKADDEGPYTLSTFQVDRLLDSVMSFALDYPSIAVSMLPDDLFALSDNDADPEEKVADLNLLISQNARDVLDLMLRSWTMEGLILSIDHFYLSNDSTEIITNG